MKKQKILFSVFATSVFILGFVLLVLPSTSVYARSGADSINPPAADILAAEPTPPVGTDERIQKTGLQQLLKHAKINHENQQKMINKAEKLGNRIADLISRAKENGKNTTNLEAALSEFNRKIGEIRVKYDQVGIVLNQHSGFDDSGKVTDPAIAKTTLETIRNGSKEIRQMLVESLKGLKDAGKSFRDANPKPTPAGASTANPA